jgi:ribonuclease G
MAKNLLVISVDIKETRVALIENGIIAELHIERSGNKDAGSVGDVVLGRVTRVLPGLQAAFIDIGQERAAFLHVEDLIRPDDFDTYLAGGRKNAKRDDADVDVTPEATGNEELDAEVEADLKDAPVAAEALATAEVNHVDKSEDGASVGAAAADSRPHALGEELPATSEDGTTLDAEDVREARDASDSSGPVADGDVEPAAWSDPELEDSSDDEDEDDVEGEEEPAEERASDPIAVQRPSERELEMGSLPVAPLSVAPLAPGAGTHARKRHTTPLDDFFNLPGFTVSNPGDPTPVAPARPRADGAERRDGWRGEGGGGRRRGRGRGGDRGRSNGRPGEAQGGEGRQSDRQARAPREGRSAGGLGRISKTTPIRDVVKEGQEIIVQVSKDPIGTKGARCTSHISLPGRYVVYVPTVDHVGVSKRIGSEKERARLRETIEAMKPPSGGLIVRTVAEGLTKKQLKADVGYLVRLWGEIAKKREGAKAPTLLSSELDLVLKTARDLFTDEVDQIVIDDKHQHDRLCHFVEMFMPERMKDIVYYSDSEPIFDAYGIEDEIGRALSRKVPLPSGGHLVIDQAEALTAIDVNTGRFVGKGSKDMEETILKTNLEAVHEIAYQLRFRNIGGLIILDLIDMERHGNREKVRRALEELLVKDKAKTTLNRISDLGLIEMTRKRTRESLGRLLHEPCFYCDGTGQLQSKETIAYEILREIRRRRQDLPGYTVIVHAHPAVADLLQGSEKDAVADAENKYMRKITVIPRTEYHLEQFDLSGK